jgi:hypothetical protein
MQSKYFESGILKIDLDSKMIPADNEMNLKTPEISFISGRFPFYIGNFK